MNMTTDFKIVEEPKRPLAMNAKKFGLWLFIITVVMIFAALTSAYIVRQAEGNWLVFELPVEMYYTTVVIFLSSITILYLENDSELIYCKPTFIRWREKFRRTSQS